MPQSSDEQTPKTAEEAFFEMPHQDSTNETTQYFNLMVQSIWGTVVGMVETQRRMLKQLQQLRYTYNQLSDITGRMLEELTSPHHNPMNMPRQSRAAQILTENTATISSDILNGDHKSSSPAPKRLPAILGGNQNDDPIDSHKQNLWKRK